MPRPAIRIILKPLQREAPKGMRLYGTATCRTIRLDPRHPHVVETYLHERIHVENPGWSETKVRRETARRWKGMGWRDKAVLLKELAQARIGEEGEE